MYVSGTQRPEEGVGSPDPEVTDGCEPPHGLWELNLAPLEEQPMLFIAEPLLHSRP